MSFYRKYRSKTFSEMVGQSHVIGTLLAGVKNDNLVHAYLLTGPRGIGKTSTARLLAKAINCTNLCDGEPCNECESCLEINAGNSIDVVEIDAASHTGVDDVRDLIEKARLAPTKSKKKIYIIDEVHMLSKSAFNALLKTLEEPPAHVVFIMATTEVHKIPATIVSRAQRYDFRRATTSEIIENLQRVAKAESIETEAAALDLIAVAANGGHRDALSILEQIASIEQKVTVAGAKKILGLSEASDIDSFIAALLAANAKGCLALAQAQYDQGRDMAEFIKSIIEGLRRILLCKITGEILFETTTENAAKVREQAAANDEKILVERINNFIQAGVMQKETSSQLLPLEIAIVQSTALHKNSLSASQPVSQPTTEVVSKPITPIAPTIPKPVANPDPPITPKPPTSSADDSDSVPVPVLEMTKDIWQAVIEKTKEKNGTLAALLRDARPAEVTESNLTLGVKFPFHKDKLSEPQNRQLLEKIICDVTGSKYNISCKLETKKAAPKAPADPNEIEKAVSEVFET